MRRPRYDGRRAMLIFGLGLVLALSAIAACSRSDEQAKLAFSDRVASAAPLGQQYPRFRDAMATESERARAAWESALAMTDEEARNDAMNDVIDDRFPVQKALKDTIDAVRDADKAADRLANKRVRGLNALSRDRTLDAVEQDIAEAKAQLTATGALAGEAAVDLLESIEHKLDRARRKAKDKLKALSKKKK